MCQILRCFVANVSYVAVSRFLGVILNGFLFGKFLNIAVKRGFFFGYYIIVASIDVWQSYFAHTCYQTHFTLFCCKFTFVASYTLSRVK